ncbi:MAG TPA: hypothetical protein VMX17_05970 [Candidatus Glassbacteria bacterium]|nr:hypothetical protein [Candidatus Glassbacteria bacterium]
MVIKNSSQLEKGTNSIEDDYIYTAASGNRASFATYRRNMMKWLVPEVGFVEMYVNPQSVSVSNAKTIKSDRTKGGFIIQYWGEELTDIKISGTTGTSGIEGINVLEDVYRGEQVAFNVIAINEQAKQQEENVNSWIDTIFPSLGDALDFFSGFGANDSNTPFPSPKPTLGYYASAIELYWHGMIYRGFFTNFSVTERSDNLGWFDYEMGFKATLIKGRRSNFMPWHRNPQPGNEFTPSSPDYSSTLSFNPVDSNSITSNVVETFLKG